MFVKKSQAVELPPIAKRPSQLDSAQLKQLNHEFFLLVRDQKYEEAFAVGSIYLQYYPENHAVQQFCHFIKHNRQQLRQMVQEENDYTDDSEEEEDEEGEDSDDDDAESVTSSASEVSLVSSKASSLKAKSTGTTSVSSIKSIPVKSRGGKENAELCKGHKWDHNCKNKDCPNRKKQQK